MNAREKKMALALAAVMGFGIVAALTYFWFIAPFKANRLKIAQMEMDNQRKEMEIDEFKTEQARLFLAKAKSLPASANEASAVYMNYLETVFRESGLHLDDLVPSQNAVEVKPVSDIPNIKKTGHRMMTFTLKAKGYLSQLVSLMEQMRKTPFEHRIKNLKIDCGQREAKGGNVPLIVNMTIEALLVAGTANKPGVPPGVDVRCVLFDSLAARTGGPAGLGQAVATILLKQAEPPATGRRYADIAKRNIFVGSAYRRDPFGNPIGPGKGGDPNDPYGQDPSLPSPGPIPAFIRLVQVEANKEEARYLNLFYTKDERKLSSKPNSGYNIFVIASDDSSYTFFRAKVLRIDNRDVFFQVKDKVYQWHVGDKLENAMQSALSIGFMDAIELDLDFAWAKKEMEKEEDGKAKDKTKQPPRKGGGRGG